VPVKFERCVSNSPLLALLLSVLGGAAGCAEPVPSNLLLYYLSPMHRIPHFRRPYGHRPGDFLLSEGPARRSLVIPFHSRLTDIELEEV
jgi:hypothetical protein